MQFVYKNGMARRVKPKLSFQYIYIFMYIHICLHKNIRRAFGPSACRDPFWMVVRTKGPIFNWSWGLQPRNFTSSNTRNHFGAPLALQGSFFYGFVDRKFRINFRMDVFHVWLFFCWTNVGPIVVPFCFDFRLFFEIRYCINFRSNLEHQNPTKYGFRL